MLVPAEPEAIATNMGRVMVSYYTPSQTPQEVAQVIDNFVEALADLPQWAISEACREWLRDGKHRPSPAHIRELAGKHVGRVHAELRRRVNEAPPAESVTAETRQRRIAQVQELVAAGKLPKALAGGG